MKQAITIRWWVWQRGWMRCPGSLQQEVLPSLRRWKGVSEEGASKVRTLIHRRRSGREVTVGLNSKDTCASNVNPGRTLSSGCPRKTSQSLVDALWIFRMLLSLIHCSASDSQHLLCARWGAGNTRWNQNSYSEEAVGLAVKMSGEDAHFLLPSISLWGVQVSQCGSGSANFTSPGSRDGHMTRLG